VLQHGITEAEAFSALQAGDEQGLDHFFNRYYAPLVYYAQSLTHNQGVAEEIASECFVKLWNYRTRLTDAAKVKALLFRIAYNGAIDSIREQQTRTKHATLFARQPAVPAENEALHKLAETGTFYNIHQLLHHLPPRTRQIFVLFYFGDRSHQEIARQLGLTVSTVRGLKHRAVQLLKKHLDASIVLIFFFLPLF